jgi:nucleoside phosphorylase
MTVSPEISADIVLLTVNKHEQTQLTAVLEHHLNHRLEPIQGASNEVYLDAGEINGQHVMVAQSRIGSTGSGASFDTVTNILDDLSPQVIIAVGIAWGAKNADGQCIGDILLSARLRDAQHHKVTPEKVTPRGTIVEASGTLLKTFIRAAEYFGKRTHEGLLISIETLFDDEQHRDKFIAADEDQAIGGEMEGSGLLMSLDRKSVV